jgi:hypothetical protein
MINRYFKEDYDYSKTLKKLGKSIVQNESEDRTKFFDEEGLTDDEDDVNLDDEEQDEVNQRELDQILNFNQEEMHTYYRSKIMLQD